jgi:hypothetical protein
MADDPDVPSLVDVLALSGGDSLRARPTPTMPPTYRGRMDYSPVPDQGGSDSGHGHSHSGGSGHGHSHGGQPGASQGGGGFFSKLSTLAGGLGGSQAQQMQQVRQMMAGMSPEEQQQLMSQMQGLMQSGAIPSHLLSGMGLNADALAALSGGAGGAGGHGHSHGPGGTCGHNHGAAASPSLSITEVPEDEPLLEASGTFQPASFVLGAGLTEGASLSSYPSCTEGRS